MSLLKQKVMEAIKDAMRGQLKDRLTTLRMATAAFKQKEVDERIELTDAQIVDILVKMIKQRKEAALQFLAAARHELADKEQAEIAVLEEFLPKQLSLAEIQSIVGQVVADLQATSINDMGRVMTQLKSMIAGQADMAVVGQQVKSLLS